MKTAIRRRRQATLDAMMVPVRGYSGGGAVASGGGGAVASGGGGAVASGGGGVVASGGGGAVASGGRGAVESGGGGVAVSGSGSGGWYVVTIVQHHRMSPQQGVSS